MFFDLRTGPRVRWLSIIGGIAVLVVFLLLIANPVLSRWARDSAMRALEESYDVQIKRLDVNLFPRAHVTGEGLVFRPKGRTDMPPLITITRLSADTGWIGLLTRHLSQVRLDGLRIQVPPRQEEGAKHEDHKAAPYFVIGEVTADGTVLTIIPKKAGKEPLEFDISRLTLHGAGPDQPMTFRATLTNAKPPGEIHSTGKFGPWQMDEPGSTRVAGNYTFQNANLGVFKGIAGTLSSEGKYEGVLDRINVEGHTDVPDFTVLVGGHPVHLTTEYKAVVDGMNGDTELDPVTAHFGHSAVSARGGVDNRPGEKGKTTSLNVTVTNGKLEDMLRLAVKGEPAMTGAVNFRTKLIVPPGDIDVAEKLQLDGKFEIDTAHFSQLNVQEKVDQLSNRGRGQTDDASDDSVASNFKGSFVLKGGVMTFSNLSFDVPGVRIALNGTYGLLDERLNFHGTASLQAKLSQTTTGFKSFLLKAVDPLFKRKTAGAVIPIKIEGTRSAPSFGLSLERGSR